MSDGGEDQGAEEALWGSRESVSSVLEAVSRVSERLSFQRRSLLSGSPPNGGHWGQRQSGQLGTSSPGTYSRRLPQRSCTPWTDCEVMMGGGWGFEQSLQVWYDFPNKRFRAEFLHTQRTVLRRYDQVCGPPHALKPHLLRVVLHSA